MVPLQRVNFNKLLALLTHKAYLLQNDDRFRNLWRIESLIKYLFCERTHTKILQGSFQWKECKDIIQCLDSLSRCKDSLLQNHSKGSHLGGILFKNSSNINLTPIIRKVLYNLLSTKINIIPNILESYRLEGKQGQKHNKSVKCLKSNMNRMFWKCRGGTLTPTPRDSEKTSRRRVYLN